MTAATMINQMIVSNGDDDEEEDGIMCNSNNRKQRSLHDDNNRAASDASSVSTGGERRRTIHIIFHALVTRIEAIERQQQQSTQRLVNRYEYMDKRCMYSYDSAVEHHAIGILFHFGTKKNYSILFICF